MKTKEQLLNDLYPNGAPFAFDYALPHQICEMIAETVSAKTGENMADLYSVLFFSVYAYGKDKDNGQGFIPLTREAFDLLFRYSYISGNVLFYVPCPSFSIRKGK